MFYVSDMEIGSPVSIRGESSRRNFIDGCLRKYSVHVLLRRYDTILGHEKREKLRSFVLIYVSTPEIVCRPKFEGALGGRHRGKCNYSNFFLIKVIKIKMQIG